MNIENREKEQDLTLADSPSHRRPSNKKSPNLLIVLLVSVAAAILAFGLSFLFAPKFESYATYYFPLNTASSSLLAAAGGGGTPDKGSVNGLGGALTSPLIGSAPQTAIGIFTSRSCRQIVIDGAKKRGVDSKILDDKELMEATDAKVDRNGLLRLSVVAETPEIARDVTREYQRAFEIIAQKLTLNVSKRNRVLLENRLKNLRVAADRSERDLLMAVSKPGAVDFDLAKSNILETEKQLIEVRRARAATQAKLKSLISSLGKFYDAEVRSPGATTAIESPLLAALVTRKLAFEDARKAFQPGSAEYQRTEQDYLNAVALIQGLATNKADLARVGIDPQSLVAISEYSGQAAAEKDLEHQLDDLRKRAAKTATGTGTIDNLVATTQQLRKTIAQLDTEYQLALIAEARDPSRFEVLDQAEIVPEPVFPRRILIAALAFAIMFAVLSVGRGLSWIRRQEDLVEG